MKLIIDTDYYDEEDFDSLLECVKNRNVIRKKIDDFNNGKLKEIELEMNRSVCCYLAGERLKENKDFIRKFFELAMDSNERDINSLKKRLGIEEV